MKRPMKRYHTWLPRFRPRSLRKAAVQAKRARLGLPVNGKLRYWTRRQSYEVAAVIHDAEQVRRYAAWLERQGRNVQHGR
jgi:hypothetical protein